MRTCERVQRSLTPTARHLWVSTLKAVGHAGCEAKASDKVVSPATPVPVSDALTVPVLAEVCHLWQRDAHGPRVETLRHLRSLTEQLQAQILCHSCFRHRRDGGELRRDLEKSTINCRRHLQRVSILHEPHRAEATQRHLRKRPF